MEEQVLFVRNRKGAYHTVTRSHYEANREAAGLVIVDERELLKSSHCQPDGETVRAVDVEPEPVSESPAPVVSEPKRRGRKPKG